MSDAPLTEAPPAAWVPSPLLQGSGSPRFVRVAWDEKKVDNFGPWRIGRSPDPTHVMPEPDPEPVAEAVTEAPMDDEAPSPDAAAEPGMAGVSTEELIALEVQAYERGVAEGRAQVLAEAEAERVRHRELLRHIAIECQGLAEPGPKLNEPLRRLALHVAEQLLRTELQTSGQAITRLVEQVVAQLDGAAPVVVHLNPDDWDRVQALQAEPQPGIQWTSDPDLSPGSVRVRANDAVVEDLIEHRLEAMADQLLLAPQARAKVSQRAGARRRAASNEVEDVQDVSVKPARSRRPKSDVEDA